VSGFLWQILPSDRFAMSTAADRAAYLDAFVAAGIIQNIQQLRSLSEDEFQGCLLAIDGGPSFEGSRPRDEVQSGIAPLRKLTLDEKIQLLKRPKDSMPIAESLEQGRRLGREFLASYNADVKPRVISSGLSALH
jgi:hypothetical protein